MARARLPMPEVRKLAGVLRYYGHNPALAPKLLQKGMSAQELAFRLKVGERVGRTRRSGVGMLETTAMHPREIIGTGGNIGGITAGDIQAWIHLRQEGPWLIAKCCTVRGAEHNAFEARVHLPTIEAAIRQALLNGDPAVGNIFGSALKVVKGAAKGTASLAKGAVKVVTSAPKSIASAAKAVGTSSLIKSVTNTVKSIAKNPITQMVFPPAAIAVHTMDRALGGKGVIKGKLGQVVDAGTALSMAAGGGAFALAGGALKSISPSALKAFSNAQNAIATVQKGVLTSQVAKVAQESLAKTKAAAATIDKAVAKKTIVRTPAVEKAMAALAAKGAATRAATLKAAPVLAANLAAAQKTAANVVALGQQAVAGNTQAQIAKGVLLRTQQMQDEVAAINQSGVPGLVINQNGAIKYPPKGLWIRTSSNPSGDMLYRGSEAMPLEGTFSAVQGGQTKKIAPKDLGLLLRAKLIEPAARTRDGKVTAFKLTPAGRILLAKKANARFRVEGQQSIVGGVPNDALQMAQARARVKALLNLARARAYLKNLPPPKVGSDDMSHYDLPEEMIERSDLLVGADIMIGAQLIGCGNPVSGVIAGFPSYLLERRGLDPATVRRRVAGALAAMTPKMRRRVIARLKHAALAARVSGYGQNPDGLQGPLYPVRYPNTQGYPMNAWATVGSHFNRASMLTP